MFMIEHEGMKMKILNLHIRRVCVYKCYQKIFSLHKIYANGIFIFQYTRISIISQAKKRIFVGAHQNFTHFHLLKIRLASLTFQF
jgi:hypothetical protein